MPPLCVVQSLNAKTGTNAFTNSYISHAPTSVKALKGLPRSTLHTFPRYPLRILRLNCTSTKAWLIWASERFRLPPQNKISGLADFHLVCHGIS